jgi:hypothetical protein
MLLHAATIDCAGVHVRTVDLTVKLCGDNHGGEDAACAPALTMPVQRWLPVGATGHEFALIATGPNALEYNTGDRVIRGTITHRCVLSQLQSLNPQ